MGDVARYTPFPTTAPGSGGGGGGGGGAQLIVTAPLTLSLIGQTIESDDSDYLLFNFTDSPLMLNTDTGKFTGLDMGVWQGRGTILFDEPAADLIVELDVNGLVGATETIPATVQNGYAFLDFAMVFPVLEEGAEMAWSIYVHPLATNADLTITGGSVTMRHLIG